MGVNVAKINVEYLGDFRCNVSSAESKISFITDARNDEGGISPTDLLTASLAVCTVSMMDFISQNHNFSIDGTKVEAIKELDETTHTIIKFILNIKLPNSLGEKELHILRETAKHCPVKKALNNDIEVQVNFID